MTGWFEFNGVRCTDLGIVVSTLPPVTLAEERVKFEDVVGRSGSLTVLEGEDVYNDMTLTAECWWKDMSKLPEASSFLRGSGKVKFANRPEGTYRCRVTNQIAFEKIVRGSAKYRKFAVNFRCKPFLYLDESPDIVITESNTVYQNMGNVFSEPIITLYPSSTNTEDDEIILTVGGQMIELYGLTTPITIDSDAQEASWNGKSMNSHMAGDFPVLPEGYFTVMWNGYVDRVVITPHWRVR